MKSNRKTFYLGLALNDDGRALLKDVRAMTDKRRIRKIPQERIALIATRRAEGKTYDEIAAELHISAVAVYFTLHPEKRSRKRGRVIAP